MSYTSYNILLSPSHRTRPYFIEFSLSFEHHQNFTIKPSFANSLSSQVRPHPPTLPNLIQLYDRNQNHSTNNHSNFSCILNNSKQIYCNDFKTNSSIFLGRACKHRTQWNRQQCYKIIHIHHRRRRLRRRRQQQHRHLEHIYVNDDGQLVKLMSLPQRKRGTRMCVCAYDLLRCELVLSEKKRTKSGREWNALYHGSNKCQANGYFTKPKIWHTHARTDNGFIPFHSIWIFM